MKQLKWFKSLVGPLLVLLVIACAWPARDWIFGTKDGSPDESSAPASAKSEMEILELGAQARKNLSLSVKVARPTSYWRTITIPGVVADRPGISDRGVTSPAVGTIAEIHVFPGDTVRPGERLVTIALFSEYLHATQTQLYKATQEIALIEKDLDRLTGIANSGGIAGSKIIGLQNDIQRQQALSRSTKQELLNRGLSPSQIEGVIQGNFVSRIEVIAPPPRSNNSFERNPASPPTQQNAQANSASSSDVVYEVQALAVELGQTVQAGQLVADLADHQHLYVVGHAFKRESALLEIAAQENRGIEIEFSDDDGKLWPPLNNSFAIRHLSNSIDTESRTFDFFVPLKNQSKSYENGDETYLVWRFRPGQRTRIHVPVERIENVFVLPSESIAREGPNAFVYRQNGDLFNQIPVNILHEDRRSIVVANDGSITPGTFIAQNAGASLRRVLKSQAASGEQPGLHVHADGTVHAAH